MEGDIAARSQQPRPHCLGPRTRDRSERVTSTATPSRPLKAIASVAWPKMKATPVPIWSAPQSIFLTGVFATNRQKRWNQRSGLALGSAAISAEWKAIMYSLQERGVRIVTSPATMNKPPIIVESTETEYAPREKTSFPSRSDIVSWL